MTKTKKATKTPTKKYTIDRSGLIRIGFDVDKKTRRQLEVIQKRKGNVALRELFLKAVGIKVA